jgi:thioredoxin-like negative regulator of GroEL
LRAAAEESRRNRSRDGCRAALALGVALAAANRLEEALLEALDALARAREYEDARGEQACLRFLSQLAATVGHHDVAEAWATVAG